MPRRKPYDQQALPRVGYNSRRAPEVARDWHKGSGGLLVVSFLTSVAIGMALELGQLLLNHVCCKCCPCHDDDAITDAPAGQQRAGAVVVAQPASA